jgi:6,7-dimethyl-8-ribityllumazine synthase
LDGARSTLLRHDVAESAIDIVRVPGAFELPLAVQRSAKSGRYDGIIALAAVIRGDTPHFEYVSDACVGGLAHVALAVDVPVGFGVLTVNTVDQASERAGPDAANKGSEAALAAMEMVSLFRELVI